MPCTPKGKTWRDGPVVRRWGLSPSICDPTAQLLISSRSCSGQVAYFALVAAVASGAYLARSTETFNADSEAEVAGETDMEEDIEKGDRCNCILRRDTSGVLAFRCICMRQGTLSVDCNQVVSGAASYPRRRTKTHSQ